MRHVPGRTLALLDDARHRAGMGIGVNRGSFTSGNVGSARRLEYTVHGDTVSTASRLEGMTNDPGRSILMADATCRALAHRPDDLDFDGEFDVRGRRAAISLWTLASGSL